MSRIHHKTLTDPIIIAGLQIRTGNSRELSGLGQIGPLWQRFFAENLPAQIPHRTSDSLFVVYSNYASDENGEYDYLLGCQTTSIENLPPGVTFAAIATGNYATITTEKGPVVDVLQDAWKRIWAMPADELGGRRAFLTDYEVYDGRAADPENAQVEIHLSLEQTI
jgi:predicted transcriptional regulator YdeE